MEREQVWAPSPTEGYSIATLSNINGDDAVIEHKDGKSVKVKKKDILPYKDVHEVEVQDMINMNDAHEAPILHNLKKRYMDDKIYTYIGPVVISVNPFKSIPVYTPSIMSDYLNSTNTDDLPPHLFAVAQNAYKSLVLRGESQSIVISGESGAGKTEATKYILQYLTVATGYGQDGVMDDLSDRILATNPVLEAFGNAKTVRNNNSSRFGKFISIAFTSGGKISGAFIDNYLLETTRVVFQAPNERNYHIFYQLIAGVNDNERREYLVYDNPQAYKYLTNGAIKVDHTDDKANFLKLKQSLDTLGITPQEQSDLFSLVSGIMHLGNIEFQGEKNDEAVSIKDVKSLRIVCKLLKTPEKLLMTSLTQRFFSGGGRPSGYNIPLKPNEAVENRDALSKALYSRLFDYLIKRLNKPLMGKSGSDLSDETKFREQKFIGVLDIYGFEVFKVNSLEQFCINYANEKLHQQFNEHMFKAEQAMYVKEGVPWQTISFIDNQDCIDLIENPAGVLGMLDEEGRIPRGSDKSYLDKLKKKWERHPKFKTSPKTPDLFSVVHYAGMVDYTAEGFLVKNKDTITKDLISALWSSELLLVQEMFSEEFEDNKTTPTLSTAADRRNKWDGKAREKDKKATVTSRFKSSLTKLVTMLSSSSRHYVRCIKPNDLQQSLIYDGTKVLIQLRSNGVFETVHMRKAGFASHTPFEQFFSRFSVLGIRDPSTAGLRSFLTSNFDDQNQWTIGNTKVFLKDKAVDKLETKRREIYVVKVLVLQTYIRSYAAKLKLQDMIKQRQERIQKAAIVLQKNVRRLNAFIKLQNLRKLDRDRKEKACIRMQTFIRSWNAKRQLIERILQERKRREEERRKLLLQEEEKRKLEEKKRQEEEERKKMLLLKQQEEERKKLAQQQQQQQQEEEKRKAQEEEKKRLLQQIEEEKKKQQQQSDDTKRREMAVIIIQKYIRTLYAKRCLLNLIIQERRRREERRKKAIEEANTGGTASAGTAGVGAGQSTTTTTKSTESVPILGKFVIG
eukprot:TRINITY_DN1065_c0_g1_i2.p1 TRINITY_DN1065_c0_g1~~TRINITY_DN1065_c0_g1_i2.p1  ORF type:complete len:1017 (+),score=306.82 TRINITY_DN1065_c0_g1_i2:263-3313(+)